LYRDVFKLNVCTAIGFNHESPFRNEYFVTRKITKAVSRIKYGLQDKLKLGNLYAMRDWGHAKDYVNAYWMMLNHENKLRDYIVATADSITVKEFVNYIFKEAGFTNLAWEGEVGSTNERLIDTATQKVLVEIDPQFFRQGEVEYLRGDASEL